jgi:hypothetical protein
MHPHMHPRTYRTKISIKNNLRNEWNRTPGCGATSAANYMVILTPPAASAGRDSMDDFGLGGAGGAIVTGT